MGWIATCLILLVTRHNTRLGTIDHQDPWQLPQSPLTTSDICMHWRQFVSFKRYKKAMFKSSFTFISYNSFSSYKSFWNNFHYYSSKITSNHACRTSSKDGFAPSLSSTKRYQASLKATMTNMKESRIQYLQLEPRPLLSSSDLLGAIDSYPLSGCINGL